MAGAAFLFVLHCVRLNDAMIVGGCSEWGKPDIHVINLVTKFRPQIEETESRKFEWFLPVSYKKQQFVSGSNYKIKVMYDDGYLTLKIYKLMPYLKEEPSSWGTN